MNSLLNILSLGFLKDGLSISLIPSKIIRYTRKREVQLPPVDADSILVDETAPQTLRNKQLTLPKVNENAPLTATSTELNQLDGINLQAELDNKQQDVISARGDLVVGDLGGGPSKLAIGTDGQVLTSDGATAGWESLPAATATQMGLVKGGQVPGTNTNDNANAGNVGEYIFTNITTPANMSSGVVYPVASIIIPAGDWDVTAGITLNTTTTVSAANYIQLGIGPVSGSNAGAIYGFNYIEDALFKPSSVYVYMQKFIPSYRLSLSSSTTFYLNALVNYTGGQMEYVRARLSARRVR